MQDEWYDHDNERFGAVAAELGVTVDALVFVADAVGYAPQYLGDEPGDVDDVGRHCSAQELCQVIKLYALDMWGPEAYRVMLMFRLATSEDLGRMVFGLVSAGLLDATENDSEEDFRDVCRFDIA